MIHINFALSNPWGKDFKNLWNRSGTIVRHKAWEAEILRNRQLIGFHISYTIRQDHAGLSLEIGLFGYSISFQIYDTRHWSYKRNGWVSYNE
jgi:hypothetical protein